MSVVLTAFRNSKTAKAKKEQLKKKKTKDRYVVQRQQERQLRFYEDQSVEIEQLRSIESEQLRSVESEQERSAESEQVRSVESEQLRSDESQEERSVEIEQLSKKSSSLLIEGDQYIPEQRSWVRLWTVNLDNIFYYIKYHYGTGSVNCNGDFLKTISGFSKEGPQTIFLIGSHEACIQTVTNGVNKYGCFHTLKVNGEIVPE
ncbi:fas apoptotic inhibitory molecule 1-like isoform X8 [Octopus sinensis]|uniref:Fas apoptotic inhibitory molecule 1-like isoform X8 n=1 Tax=Octopus sinensis TaxID=2607531 RepID=A0A7E6FK35_9MOLL|nr:fas apoptotic inhibitory molecule 1-like isoform X8 [Octopus sinensis]